MARVHEAVEDSKAAAANWIRCSCGWLGPLKGFRIHKGMMNKNA